MTNTLARLSASIRFDHRTLRRVGETALLMVVLARSLTPVIGGVVTNDSLGYLSRSRDPFADGLVVQGYRQVAYPIWVRVADLLGTPFGWDYIFAVGVLQRTLFVFGVVLIWQALRLWATPLLLLVTSASLVGHTDLILPEGLLIPGCLVGASLAASAVSNRGIAKRFPKTTVVLSVALAMALGAVKLQYASLLLLAAATAWLLFRDAVISRRLAIGVLTSGIAFFAVLSVAQAFENNQELGVLEPVGERIRAEWYGSWQAVFAVNPDNALDPALAEYYAKGNLYTFMHGTEASVPEYADRIPLFHERIDEMFALADTGRREQQLAALWGAVQGGRTDDIAGLVDRVAADESAAQESRLTQNGVGRTDGAAAVLSWVNNGETPAIVNLEPLLGPSQWFLEDYRRWRPQLGILAVLLSLVGLAVPGRHRWFNLAALGLVLGVSMVLSSAYIDNARYLVGPMIISGASAIVAVRALTSAILARFNNASPTTPRLQGTQEP